MDPSVLDAPALRAPAADGPAPGLGAAALTTADLTAVVQQAVGRRLDLGEWQVTPVGGPATAISTEAVLQVHGLVRDGHTSLSWAVLVKILRSARHWPLIEVVPASVRQNFIDSFQWHVEADVLASDLPGRLPPGMRTPRVFRIDHLGDDRVALWLEYVDVADVAWDRARYVRAARLLGRWAARQATAMPVGPRPAPRASGLRVMAAGPLARKVFPQLRDDIVWSHPLLAATADPSLRHDLLTLANQVPALLDRLEALPSATGHGDACPQNLLVPQDAPDTFIAIDISWQQPEALGFDLGQLLVGRAHSGDLNVSAMPELHDALVLAYLQGLRDEDRDADPADVRYGCDAAMVIRSGFTSLPLDQLLQPPTPGFDAEMARRAALARYVVDVGLALSR